MNSIRANNEEMFPLILIAVAGAVIAVLLNYLTVIPIILLIIFLISTIDQKKTLLWIVIVTLLTLVGELGPGLRVIIQIMDIAILLYLFLSKFGLAIKNFPRVPKTFISFLVFYYIAIVLSIAMSNHPFAGVVLLIRQTVFFAIIYFLYALIEDESDIKNYFYALIFAAVVMASSSIFSFLFSLSTFFYFESGSRDRIAGIISNPNNIANFYVVSFPLLLISIIKKKSVFSARLSWLLIPYFSFALILTISRSAIISIAISTLIILYFVKRKHFYYILIFSCLVAVVIFFNETIYDYLSFFFRIERGVTGRDYLWELSINIIKDNPLFGLGPGGYKYEMFNYFPVMMDSWIGELFKKTYEITDGANLSHSYYLFMFSELGIFGFIASLFLLILFLRFVKIISWIKDKTSGSYYMVVALLAIGFSEFVRGIVESIGILYYGAITADLPFWLVFISLTFYTKSKFNKSKSIAELNKKSIIAIDVNSSDTI